MAATLDLPVIDQADYILRQGARLSDARWPHDYHWNPAGHRWAAETLLEPPLDANDDRSGRWSEVFPSCLAHVTAERAGESFRI